MEVSMNGWMVYVMENAHLKWMRTGAIPFWKPPNVPSSHLILCTISCMVIKKADQTPSLESLEHTLVNSIDIR